MRILVIEDNKRLRESVVQGLHENGHAVDATSDGEEAVLFARVRQYDVVLLDLMLPGMDGYGVLRTLRDRGNAVAILIMTARDAVDDRVKGLDLGADDYLVKPFALKELLARVRALARRVQGASSAIIRVADMEVDSNKQTVRRAGKEIDLSARDFAILEVLAFRAGQVVTRPEILDKIYNIDSEPSSNVVDVYIRRLRSKLEEGGLSRLIHTRRGFGYVLEDRVGNRAE